MEDNLQVFKNNLFEVAIKLENGECVYEAETVAKSLGLSEYKNGVEYVMWRRVNQYLKSFGTSVEKGDFIPESAVYKLAFKASSAIAERFQDWLAVEVIPTIRKTGGYISNADLMVNTYFGALGQEHKGLIKGLFNNIEEQQKQLQLKQSIIEEQQPKVAKFEQVVNSEGLTDMNALAKILAEEFNGKVLGRNKLMNKLRIMKVLTAGNLPYQQYMDRGYFVVKKEVVNGRNFNVTFITPKGIDWLIGKLNKELAAMQERQRIYGF